MASNASFRENAFDAIRAMGKRPDEMMLTAPSYPPAFKKEGWTVISLKEMLASVLTVDCLVAPSARP